MASTSPCRGEDPGSIPGWGVGKKFSFLSKRGNGIIWPRSAWAYRRSLVPFFRAASIRKKRMKQFLTALASRRGKKSVPFSNKGKRFSSPVRSGRR